MADSEERTYGLANLAKTQAVVAPDLPYRPQEPKEYRPAIALIGCGGISEQHLLAYQKAGYRVTALVDRHLDRAEARRDRFFPKAAVYTDYRQALDRADIEVVDLTPHPPDRVPIMEDALRAGKHVLSQKPFVLDLDQGVAMVDLAKRQSLRLAVNQNGRWAPHFSYMRQAVNQGLIGKVVAAHLSVHWNHHWIVGTPFEEIHHLVLYDFGIHWFDMLNCLMGSPPWRVFATTGRSAGQSARPPLLAQALVEYENAQASLIFDADTRFDPLDQGIVIGTLGTLKSSGPDLQQQTVTLATQAGVASPRLDGKWFPDGFHGAMAELLCAIEEGREPGHSARNNLTSLALCFAAAASADTGQPIEMGSVRRLPTNKEPLHAS